MSSPLFEGGPIFRWPLGLGARGGNPYRFGIRLRLLATISAMETEPVRNNDAGVSTLFDVAEGSEAGTPCEGPGCTNLIPARPGRGRPRKTCSQSCKSRAARARTEGPRSAATAVAGSAASPDGEDQVGGERPADGQMSDRDNYRHRVLTVAGALRTHAVAFLAAVDEDPVSAHRELMERVYNVTSLLNMSARDVRDQARWPGLDADERTEARMREEWNLPDTWTLADGTPDSDRSEIPAPATTPDRAAEPDRSENAAALAPASAAPIADRSEITTVGRGTATDLTAASADDALLRAALADPYVRFSGPGRVDDLAFTFGEGWELVTWKLVDGESVQLLRHQGASVGWTALLPDGRWGLGGWIAVQHQGAGLPGRFVADRFSRPQTYPSADLALDVFYRTTVPTTPALGPELAGAVPADGVPVPDLALGEPTGWTPPTLRGLGSPRRDYGLGKGLVHLTWRGKSGVHALEQRGQLAGWVEAYDEDGNWTAVITGRPVVDAADGVPLLSANPTDALTLLRLAIGQGLADLDPLRRPPRAQG